MGKNPSTLCAGIAWFGDILNIEGVLVEIGSRSVVGKSAVGVRRSQRVASTHDLTPLVPAWGGGRGAWDVRRGAGEQWPVGRWRPPTFPGCQKVGGPFRSQR